MLTRIRLFALVLLAFITVSMRTDTGALLSFYGLVLDEKSNLPLVGAEVTYTAETGETFTMKTSRKGKYDFLLSFEHYYVVKFASPGYISKTIEIESRNIPGKARSGGLIFEIDVTLFKPKPEVDYHKYAKEPVAKAYYNATSESLEFDMEYSKKFKEGINK